MQMTMREVLMIFSTAIALPVIAVLTIAFLSGGLTNTEDAKYTVLSEPEEYDYWTEQEGGTEG